MRRLTLLTGGLILAAVGIALTAYFAWTLQLARGEEAAQRFKAEIQYLLNISWADIFQEGSSR